MGSTRLTAAFHLRHPQDHQQLASKAVTAPNRRRTWPKALPAATPCQRIPAIKEAGSRGFPSPRCTCIGRAAQVGRHQIRHHGLGAPNARPLLYPYKIYSPTPVRLSAQKQTQIDQAISDPAANDHPSAAHPIRERPGRSSKARHIPD